MRTDEIPELALQWRSEAQVLERWGAMALAAVARLCADELEAFVSRRAEAPLTLAEAAAESGYSAESLARQVREGTIPNAGRKGAPRIRRGDLPIKPGRSNTGDALRGSSNYDRDRLFRDIINSKKKER